MCSSRRGGAGSCSPVRACAFLSLALAAPAVRADVIDASVTTLLAGIHDPRDGQLHTVVPIYQSVSLFIRDVKNPFVEDLKLVVSGWGAVAFGEPRDDRVTGDLDAGFIEGGLFR